MAISNELSSEIAAAILSGKKSPQELNRLKEIILQVHLTLQEMSQETRATRSSDVNGLNSIRILALKKKTSQDL